MALGSVASSSGMVVDGAPGLGALATTGTWKRTHSIDAARHARRPENASRPDERL